MNTNKYGNLTIDQLHLVRVQNGLEGIRYDNGDLLITRNTQDTNELSMRNTVHFTLNGVVSNHAYGKFDSLYAFISPFEQTAQKNENLLAGLSPSDTFFHQDQNNELRLHKPILVAPNGAEIPPELIENGLSIVRYDAPEVVNTESLAMTRNLAIANVFSVLNAPMHSIGMWGWGNAPDPTAEQRQALLNHLGYQDSDIALAHTGSPEEKVETTIAAFAYHNEAILRGERLATMDTGLQIPHSDMVNMARNQMFETLAEIKNESARQKLTDKFNEIDQKFNQLIKDTQSLEKIDAAFSHSSIDQTMPPPIPEGMDTSSLMPPPPPPIPQSFIPPPTMPESFDTSIDLSESDIKNLNSFFDQSGLSDKLDKNSNELLAAPEYIANKGITNLFDSPYYNHLKFSIHNSLMDLRRQTNSGINNDLIYDAYNSVKNDLIDFNDHYLNLIQHIPTENQENNMKFQLDVNETLFNLTQHALGDNQKTFNVNGIEKSLIEDLGDFKDNHLKTIKKSLELNKSNINSNLDNSREFDFN